MPTRSGDIDTVTVRAALVAGADYTLAEGVRGRGNGLSIAPGGLSKRVADVGR